MPPVEVIRTYLEMTAPDQWQGRAGFPAGFAVRPEPGSAALYRELYGAVGRDYHWRDRLHWTDRQIEAHLADPAICLWVLRHGDAPAGFFELARHPDGSVEIAYFGLMPGATGRGLGRALLSAAIGAAWGSTPAPGRVWLHTCTLDHPAALPNYLARGFRVSRTERYTTDLPAPA